MALPIMIIHEGDKYYLPFTLFQAKVSNPDSEVILIGNKENSHYKYSDFANHYYISDYFKEAEEFSKLYKHMSLRPHDVELFCFTRWFVLKEFMIKHNIDKCMAIDSDIMLYGNISEEQKNFKDCDFTLSTKSGHCTFINSQKGITEFCSFMTDLFTKPELLSILEQKYENHINNNLPGGVCDMTAFYEYRKRNEHKILEISKIINDSYFENHVNVDEGFEMGKKIKKIRIKGKKAYCKHLESGKMIRFNCLHFQGGAKRTIWKYYTGNPLGFIYNIFKVHLLRSINV
jgi:hypothetical protein